MNDLNKQIVLPSRESSKRALGVRQGAGGWEGGGLEGAFSGLSAAAVSTTCTTLLAHSARKGPRLRQCNARCALHRQPMPRRLCCRKREPRALRWERLEQSVRGAAIHSHAEKRGIVIYAAERMP